MTAIVESFSTTSLDHGTLLELSRRTDPAGVLSIYLDARPGTGLRAASIDIRYHLAELGRRLEAEGPPERTLAVHDGIARLESEIERLADAEEPGRGRILFAAMTDGWVRRVCTQLPVRTRVVLDHSAFIHPLLEILEEGAPAGVVLASRTQARLLEWRLGELSPLRELRAEPGDPGHERSGPGVPRPATPHGTPTGEQRSARERDQAIRFVERVASAAAGMARTRGWARVLVSGGEQLTGALVAALPPDLRDATVRDPRVLLSLDTATLANTVNGRMRAAHEEVRRRLVDEVHEGARGAHVLALGLSEVVGALNQARVEHLIYDPLMRYQGSVGHDGSLYADGEAAVRDASSGETRLTERLVERALETGARVTPVEAAGSSTLAAAAGIAAVLRW